MSVERVEHQSTTELLIAIVWLHGNSSLCYQNNAGEEKGKSSNSKNWDTGVIGLRVMFFFKAKSVGTDFRTSIHVQ